MPSADLRWDTRADGERKWLLIQGWFVRWVTHASSEPGKLNAQDRANQREVEYAD